MAVANTHVEDLCVGGVAVLLNDMAKLTLSDADLTVLTAFVRKRLVANVCRIMIYRHMHCIDTCPPLSHAHAPSRVLSHPPPICRQTSHTYVLFTLYPQNFLKTKDVAHILFQLTRHTLILLLLWRTFFGHSILYSHEEKRCTHALVVSHPLAGTRRSAFF